MRTIETNIFPISGFGGLDAIYAIWRVDGLATDHDEYHENCQRLQRRATRHCNTGVIVLKRETGPVLAVPIESTHLVPNSVLLARARVTLQATPERVHVDFGSLTSESERLALRYIQSAVSDSLRANNSLWQPDSRNVFFEKQPIEQNGQIGMYRGFGVTVTRTADRGFSLAVDVQFKFVAQQPLRSRINEQEFRQRHRMHTFVYHFGDIWYEVELEGWTNVEITAYRCGESADRRPLLSWLHEQCPKPLPPEIARLDKGGTVLEYTNADGETRGVPAELCYRMFDTQAPEIQHLHRFATRLPGARRDDIVDVVSKHLTTLRFGGKNITVNTQPWSVAYRFFQPPDLRFGSNRILSTRSTMGAIYCDIAVYGRMRGSLLVDRQAGIFSRDGLSQQYLLLPKTVENTWGPTFAQDFIQATNQICASEHGYAPSIEYYDDTAARNIIEEADAIAATAAELGGGFAVVMLAEPKVSTQQREDELAGCSAERLAKQQIIPAFIHATSARTFFNYSSVDRRWTSVPDPKGRYKSYLRLSALNKVLLTAGQWPFVLASRLHADITIGIDVKGHTAGFVGVCPTSQKVWRATAETKRKERMSRRKCREMLIDGITKLARAAGTQPAHIVVQRDGRMFEPEIEAAKDALEELKREGTVSTDSSLTCVEIPKSGGAPFRLFDECFERGHRQFRNPEYGTFVVIGPNEGFVCNTGLSFRVPGTVRPLHVKRVFGQMPIEECLEDVFYLACLTWSKPDGCSRDPVTIRLNDRQLIDVATPFDDEDDEAPLLAGRADDGRAR
jgi:hypothetical protein